MSWEQPDRSIIYWPEIDSAEAVTKARGGNPVLFPFSARTFHGSQIGKWQDTNGDVRDIPNHGITRQGQFELIDLTPGGFTARLVQGVEEQKVYPYKYHFDVSYRFAENSIEVDYRLENLGDSQIPWSAGHHFYFDLPWVAGTTREDYQIEIPATDACNHATDGSLQSVDFEPITLFSQPELVDRIHYGLQQSTIEFLCRKDGSKIAISIDSLHPEHALVTWTEADDSPFYCIEPWMGPPNAPSTNIGLHWVQPGDSESFAVKVEI